MLCRSVFLASLVLFPLYASEPLDLEMVHRIRQEALMNSKVMDHLFYLTDVHGPRVTNSKGFHAAADWAMKRLRGWGLAAVAKEEWGPFGRGWSFSRFSAHMVEPAYSPLIGFPLAWSPSTAGVLRGEVVHAVIATEADFAKHKGKLRGKIVLFERPRTTPMKVAPEGARFSDAELNEKFLWEPTPEPGPEASERVKKFRLARNRFFREEGVLAAVSTGYRGDGGTVFASYGGAADAKDSDPPPMAVVTPEHYNRMVRLLEKKIPVKVELEVAAQFFEETANSYNIIAELPGGAKRDEVVIIGAHFDSWQGGTGATDNAAGSAVMMEVMRVLKSVNRTPERTIRLALWSGEEQGLLGSKAYVKKHFADPEVMRPTDAYARMAAYFNYDNGTGKVRGIYLQGNDMVRPIFEAWLTPFRDLGATTLSIRSTFGSDQASFDRVGLPGFQFIQDPAEYQPRTHHSNMDVYDRIQPEDLKQASAIVASFAWHAAQRAEVLPRKPLPPPSRREKEKKSDSGN